jgi:hypothetical protein
VVNVYLDNEKISTTDDHPFWVQDKGWVKAKDLQTGDALQNDKEETITVNHIEHREINVKVYNFEVEGFHTYFVSDLGILVHNICKLQPFEDAQGLHTVFKFDSETGKIRSYETFIPNTNPQDPKKWQSLSRFDRFGAPHYNKATKQNVPTPHVNDRSIAGGVRPATPDEIPGR